MRRLVISIFGAVLLAATALPAMSFGELGSTPPGTTATFRYYRLGNTGVQGDWSEALWIGPDGDPWIGGYDPSFEEGGIAKFVQAEDRWIPVSNVDHKILGDPNVLGASRVRDIKPDRLGRIWFATWTALLRMDPAVGPSSLVRYDLDGLGDLGGGRDVDMAPDGTVWICAEGTLVQLDPASPRRPKQWEGGFEHIAVQPKPSGGYFVWATLDLSSGTSSPVWRYDSATRIWEPQPATGDIGEVASLPGTDVVDDAGNMWAFHSDRQPDPTYSLGYKRPDGSWVDVAAPNEGGASYVHRIRAFGQSNALMADATGRVWRYDGSSWEDLGIGGASNARIGLVGLDIDVKTGTVWASGDGGAARRDPKTGAWQRYRITNCSQGDNFVLDLSLTPSGELWTTANIGSGVGGFQHFNGINWRGFNQFNYDLPGSGPFPFPSDSTQAITYRRSNGHVAVAMPGGGVQEWTGTEYVDLGLYNWYPTRLLEDSMGHLWAGSEDTMIGVYADGEWKTFDLSLFAGGPAIDPDRPGWVWLSGIDGAVLTDGTTVEKLQLPEAGRGSAPIGNNRAWVGGTGLYRVDMETQSFEHFDSEIFPIIDTRPYFVSPDGLLWFGCDQGLCWLDTTTTPLNRGGVFRAPEGGVPQWGGLPWWPTRAELKVQPGFYEIWMTTPSRGITVLKIAPLR